MSLGGKGRAALRDAARGLLLAAALAGAACGGGSPTAPSIPPTPAPGPTPAARAVRVMPLGDSITQADAGHDSYRRPLWQMLRGQAVDFVGTQTEHFGGPAPRPDFDQDHEGHWGWRADEVLGSVADWARSQAPDVVLVHLGTNDVLQGEPSGAILEELGAIVDALRSANPEVKVLLAQIIPTSDVGRNAAIRALNGGIPALAARKSTTRSPVTAVDQHTGFDGEGDTYDGLHPNAAGEAKMAGRWFDALLPLLRPAALPWPALLSPQRQGGGRSVW